MLAATATPRPSRFRLQAWLLIPALLLLTLAGLLALACSRPQPLVLAGTHHCLVLGSWGSHRSQLVEWRELYLVPTAEGGCQLVDLRDESNWLSPPPRPHQVRLRFGRRYLFVAWW